MRYRFLLALIPALLCAQPARIVSTSPTITETLFALGLGKSVVAVTTYCRYPPAVLSLPKIGTYFKPDLEKIALLRPDLVVIHKSPAQIPNRLTALGIRYTEVQVESLADVHAAIDNIGRATSVSARAEKLNRDIRARLDGFRAQAKGNAKPRVLMLVGRDPGALTNMIAIGPGGYLAELIDLAGAVNVLSDAPVAYPHISMETVLRLNPDVILDASFMGESNGDIAGQEQRLQQPWLVHRELNAVRNGRAFGMASEALTTPGPRVADVVQLIRSKVHRR